jgi:membrane protease YdiL (CAAX protease family)
MKLLKRHPITAFFVLAIALGWIFSLPDLLGQAKLLPFSLPPILGFLLFPFAPTVAALIVVGGNNGKSGIRTLLKRVLIWRVNLWWYVIVICLPFAVQAVAIAAFVPFGGPAPQLDLSVLGILIQLPLFFAMNLGEEIGWRGFALPQLQTRYNALVSAMIVGVIWGFWHLPPTIPEFAQGTMSPQAFLLSILPFVGFSILFAWVFNNAKGSVLLMTLFHISFNAKGAFLPVVWQRGPFGPSELAGVLLIVAAVVVVFLTGPKNLSRRGTRIQASLPSSSESEPLPAKSQPESIR